MSRQMSRGKKRGRGGVRALRITIPKTARKISSEDLESSIEKHLASTKTDVFGNNDTLVIIVEQQGH